MLEIRWIRNLLLLSLVASTVLAGYLAAGAVRVHRQLAGFKEREAVVTTSRLQRHGRSSSAVIVATYSIGDQSYMVNNGRYGIDGDDTLKLRELLERYPVGRRITVYVNPDNAREAVMRRHIPLAARLGGFGITLALLIVVLVKASRIRHQRDNG